MLAFGLSCSCLQFGRGFTIYDIQRCCGKGATFAVFLGRTKAKTKRFSASGGKPPDPETDQELYPCTPLGAPPLDPGCRLALLRSPCRPSPLSKPSGSAPGCICMVCTMHRQMVSTGRLICVIMQNFIIIGQTVLEISQFFYHKYLLKKFSIALGEL